MTPAQAAARVALRKFDHDECRRLRGDGWTYPALADHFGVSEAAIGRVVNPHRRDRVAATSARKMRAVAGACRCGRPMTYASMSYHRRLGQEPRCIRCQGLDNATSVRADTLLCSTCRRWLPDDAFAAARAKAARRHRHQQCRPCNTAEKRARRAANTQHDRAPTARNRRQGVPAMPGTTEKITTCPRPSCRSSQLRHQGDEWRCTNCSARSPGYSTSTVDAPPATVGPTAARYTDDDLVAALQQHAAALGRTPSERDWVADRPAGAATIVTYRTRFGSWPAALDAAGLQRNPPSLHRSQPTTAEATVSPAVDAETPAPPPPPSEPTVTVPVEEDSEPTAGGPETPAQGVVEAPQPLPDVEHHYGFDIDRTDLVTTTSGSRLRRVLLPDYDTAARDELRLRYTRALIATLEHAEITGDDGYDWFSHLADRIERVLNLQEATT